MHYTTLISARQLADHLDHPQLVIFDCRFSLADSTAGQRHHQQRSGDRSLDECLGRIKAETG